MNAAQSGQRRREQVTRSAITASKRPCRARAVARGSVKGSRAPPGGVVPIFTKWRRILRTCCGSVMTAKTRTAALHRHVMKKASLKPQSPEGGSAGQDFIYEAAGSRVDTVR